MPEGVSVQELCERISRSVDDTFPEEVWVRGAISGISRSANGHVYFDLVESGPGTGSQQQSIPVALFAKAKYRVNAILKRTNAIRMTDGVEVQIRGRVTYYPPQSRVQLIMTLIDPAYTLGQLESAKAQLLAELRAEGLLVSNKRHRIPVLPLRVALITSVGSAAEADFNEELSSSAYNFAVTLFDTRVQGDEAVSGITKALIETGQLKHEQFDAIVLVRGGGAKTDLAAFDQGDIARAIAASALPVIVGVGHETDQSVADEVAHTSAKTPTASARVLIDTVQHFERRVSACADRIAHRSNDHLRQADLILGSYQARVARSALEAAARSSVQLDRFGDKLTQAAILGLERADVTLERADLRIRALDPANALARGWSITRVEAGETSHVLRNPDQVREGDTLVTTLLGGTVTSTVTVRTEDQNPAASLSEPTSNKTAPNKTAPDDSEATA